jgi:hypothetical protein
VTQFLAWLGRTLKIESDAHGNIGVDSLVGKTVILDYLGDYRKKAEHTSLENLWAVLQRNSRRLGCSLTSHLQEQVKKEYENSLSVLLPIKQKLAATDWLIDQLVYRLYGLTEEEISIVEAK